MTTRLALGAFALALGTASPVAGDHLQTARDQPLQEVSHTVDIRIADGVATYVVQRQFRNSDKDADEVRLRINLPTGAAATGLRIRAKQTWHAGELLERDAAAQKYQELTGRGVFDPKDPALLFWEEAGTLFLQVFPVMPRTVSTVEYTLTVPTTYKNGRYELTYPRRLAEEGGGSLKLVDPVIRVHTTATYTLEDKPVAAAARATLQPAKVDDVAPEDQMAHLGIAPAPIATWTARLGRVVASHEHAFARLEVDTAPRLSSVPVRAQVVFVIDASYSVGEELLAAQLAIVRAYARHVPDAEIEVVVYRRAAKRVFGAFIPATQLGKALASASARGALALGNGSSLDEGAKLAVGALAGRSGPHRVVITTDALVRSAFSETDTLATLAKLAPSAVVHVVEPSIGATTTVLQRNEHAKLTAFATKHHGIYASFDLVGVADPALATAALELVRPVRIDDLAITGGFTVVDTLSEGDGIRVFEERGAPAKITLTGLLWSDPIRLDVTDSATFSRATAGFVFGEGLYSVLSAPEMMTVANLARSVSPVTSYLAIEPGVRPSKIGLEGGGTGWGTIGTGRYGTIGHGSHTGSGYSTPADLQSMIDTQACVGTHRPAAGWGVKLEVETTKDEIVDVRVRNGAGALADCLVETTWRVQLGASFFDIHKTYVVDLF